MLLAMYYYYIHSGERMLYLKYPSVRNASPHKLQTRGLVIASSNSNISRFNSYKFKGYGCEKEPTQGAHIHEK